MTTRPLLRGLRNCNPCNIRLSRTKYQGEIQPSCDKAFKQFRSIDWGYRAAFVVLDHYSRNGYDTIRKIISRWAPPSENSTAAYINTICDATFHGPDEKIDTSDRDVMVTMVAAMSKVENGIPANIDDVVSGWELFQTHRP
jgi:hypothetical protein